MAQTSIFLKSIFISIPAPILTYFDIHHNINQSRYSGIVAKIIYNPQYILSTSELFIRTLWFSLEVLAYILRKSSSTSKVIKEEIVKGTLNS